MTPLHLSLFLPLHPVAENANKLTSLLSAASLPLSFRRFSAAARYPTPIHRRRLSLTLSQSSYLKFSKHNPLPSSYSIFSIPGGQSAVEAVWRRCLFPTLDTPPRLFPYSAVPRSVLSIDLSGRCQIVAGHHCCLKT